MSRDMILEKLEQAKYYAEQALHRAEDAREHLSDCPIEAVTDVLNEVRQMHKLVTDSISQN